MLINFTLNNWRSFRQQAEFSMVASREKQHGDRLARIERYKLRLLPVAAIYGGNASGKTNFFAALNFAKNLIVDGTRPDELIPVESFRLDAGDAKKATYFKFELLVDETIYEYGFAVSQERVFEERLVEVRPTTEKELFVRELDEIRFNPTLNEDQFLHFAFKGTRENQLFLTNAVQQKVENFKPVYDWFKNDLVLIAPDTRFEPFEQFLQEDSPLYETMNKCLGLLDTGIAQLGGEDVSFDNLALPEEIRTKLQASLKDGMTLRVMSPFHERYVFTRKKGEIVARKLVTYHENRGGELVKFEMGQESDGSKRVIDLLPAFLEMSSRKSTQVYVIDEVDRSLHTLLTRQLLQGYLSACSADSRSQLLLTTHDVLLMDQDILRRDEMWIAERDADGGSSLLSFSEYKDVRSDKDIRKSYLQGRLGGVPRLLISGALANGDLDLPEKEAAVGEA
ncbi:MAG: abortive phage resistance protein [Desulfuromonas sp.]|uniref:AAA family ATPase n=1 Tax=Desulfuromonas sp. TaxID=892 RepID=UPI000CBEF541|nr:ATP-binding protein [Desulfuromonas sp.]PLX83268.1 MAG: abortive phage resistance protein [Desulfuromonas sp.]